MKKKIIFGVYIIYFARKLRSPFLAESFVMLGLAVLLSYIVSIPHIVSNMKNCTNIYHYFILSFSKTALLVKLIIVSAVGTAIFFMRNLTVHTSSFIKNKFA